jgi:hypothetical protein
MEMMCPRLPYADGLVLMELTIPIVVGLNKKLLPANLQLSTVYPSASENKMRALSFTMTRKAKTHCESSPSQLLNTPQQDPIPNCAQQGFSQSAKPPSSPQKLFVSPPRIRWNYER